MIYVKLNEANFEYDIHSLVKAYFPQEDVLVPAQDKQPEEGVSFRLAIDYIKSEDGIGKEAIRFQILEPDLEAFALKKTADVAVDFSDRKETKNRLKQALYN